MITRLLEKSIRRTEAVDREALCILAGEKVSPSLPRLGSWETADEVGLATTLDTSFRE
jgi:hypothetical protein